MTVAGDVNGPGAIALQRLDDAHARAERFLCKWIERKPASCRILVVKDVLAMIRIVVCCPERE